MRGKIEETPTNELSSNSNRYESTNVNQQRIQSNPYESQNTNQQKIQSNPYESQNTDQQRIQSNSYESTNTNQQQQVTQERFSDGPPPPYIAVETPPNPKPQPEVVIQNPSINNQNFQGTPIPQANIYERHSTDVMCPTCGVIVHTRVETASSIITIGIAILLFLFCCCLAVIPFCFPFFKRTTHYCPHCHRILGTVREFE